MAVNPQHHAIRRRKNPSFQVPYVKLGRLPPEANNWWWHPLRPGVVGAPTWFETQLRDFDPDLAVTWNAYARHYLVWMRAPAFRSVICWGWKLLFPVVDGDGQYAPLDARIFARLYEASARRWGNGKRYFQRVEAEWERDRARAQQTRQEDVGATARDWYQYASIKNIGLGSKFVNHWSG